LVYEWLAGEAPFSGSLYEVFSHHLYQPPPSLCERVPDLQPHHPSFPSPSSHPHHRETRGASSLSSSVSFRSDTEDSLQ
jgi:hypothetical protein